MRYLCRFCQRKDKGGRIYYAATLGNSRLLLFPEDGGDFSFYLGGQIEPEKKSRQNQFRGANSPGPDRLYG